MFGYITMYLMSIGDYLCSFSLIEDSSNILTESVRDYLFSIQEQINQIRRDQMTEVGLNKIIDNRLKAEEG